MRRKRGKRQKKILRVHRGFIATLLIIAAVAALFQFAPIVKAHYPVPINLMLVNPNPQEGSGATSTSASGVSVHVEDAWQQWVVRYTNGLSEQFRSDYPQPITQQFQVAQTSSTPSILDLTVPVQLTTSNLPSYGGFDAAWATVINNVPTVSVWVNYRPAGAVSQSLLSPITFATGDQVGITKYWNVRIVFSGGSEYCSNTSNACLDLSGTLNGLTSAFIQIGVTIISSSYRSYSYSAGSLYCNGQWLFIGFTSGNVECLVGSSTVAVPYGVNFNWTPSATGTAALTLPTAALTQCQGNYCFVWTNTGNQTVTLWSSVRATIVGPTTTVTQNGPPVPTGGNNNGNQPSGSCQLGGGKALWGFVNLPSWTLPGWMCGNTFGLSNLVWVVIIILAFLVLIYLASRRRSSGNS